jgi:hypothetical protein
MYNVRDAVHNKLSLDLKNFWKLNIINSLDKIQFISKHVKNNRFGLGLVQNKLFKF